MRKQGDTFGALVEGYLRSPDFANLAEGTRSLREGILHAAAKALGDVPVENIVPSVVKGYINKWADFPGKQRNILSAIRVVESWAAVERDLTHYMTKGIKFAKLKGGHIPWTMDQVLHAEKHCREDLARAIVLMAWTGQRGSDAVKMCWNDITENDEGMPGIEVRQQKTGRELWCPIQPELWERMQKWPREPGPILRTIWGKPFLDRHALSELWIDELARNPEIERLRGLHLHGLRAHYCVRLYRGGMTTRDVSQIVGMSLQMVEHYTKLSDQKKNATAAILRFSDYKPLKSLKPIISMK